MINKIQAVKENLLDCLFPKSCVGCGKKDTYLCENCKSKIVIIKAPTCLGCGKLKPKGQYCKTCRPKVGLTGVIIAAHYEEGPLKEAIHTFKYDFVYDLHEELSTFLAEALKRNNFKKNYLVTYVPLHRSKENWRGFNQSKLLAKNVSLKLKFELIEEALEKNKNTKRQIELKRGERFKNVEDTFRASAKYVDKVKGKRIILVDDIITTGATLNECAKALRDIGAKEVWGLVLGKH